MKFLTALVLVVATVQANSWGHYGWTPGKESVFHYESQVLAGIPEIRESHRAGVKLTSKVVVQSFSDYTLRVKFENPEFLTINGRVELTKTGRLIQTESSEAIKVSNIPEQFKRYLEQPFLVHLKNGLVESVLVSSEEPVSITNIKKSLLSQLQLDISGSRRIELESNTIELPLSNENPVSEQISYFTTYEQTIEGECQTAYNIHKIPQWKINEMEENWTLEEQKIKGIDYQSPSVQPTLEGKRHCEGKPYYLITRTTNFDKCKVRPLYQMFYGANGRCDLSKSNCGSLINQLFTTTTVVCGDLNEFYIRKIKTMLNVKSAPMGYDTEEKADVKSLINIELLTVKSISQRLPVPSSTKEIKTLVFLYPEQVHQSSSPISEEIVRETETLLGHRPVLPQPGLTDAPNTLIPVSISKNEIISQVFEQLKTMSSEIYKSPESCSSKKDIAGTFTIVAQYMRHLGLTELEELERKVNEESQSGQKTIQQLFYKTLATVGTNPSTMLVIKRVKSGSLPNKTLVKMVQMALKSVTTPTKPLLNELVKMIKFESIKSDKQLLSTCLMELSNLFYLAYVNPSTMISNYPTNVYGIFGTRESTVLTEEFIPFLIEKLNSNDSEYIRLVVVSSLGKLGHLKSLKPLLKVAQGKLGEDPLLRSLAVYSMKRIAKMNPTEVRPLLLAAITNPVELPEVRIAAVSVLPWTMPTTTELQQICLRTWFEPSKQVSSFIYSTLRWLAVTEVPQLKNVAVKARSVLPLVNPQHYGIQYSHNMSFDKFIQFLQLTISDEMSIINSKESILPVRTSLYSTYHTDSNSMEINVLSFTAYTQGMDTLIQKYLHYFVPSSTKSTETIKSQLSKIVDDLKLKKRDTRSPKIFLQQGYSGIESSLFIDTELVLEAIEKVVESMKSQHVYEFNMISATQTSEMSSVGMSAAGFPIVFSYAMPFVSSLKGLVKSEPIEGELLPKLTAKVIPVVNTKMQFSVNCISPFTDESIGIASEVSMHSSIPIEVEVKLTQGELEMVLRNPQEHQISGQHTETLHLFIHPYSFTQNLHIIKPLSCSSVTKEITSGINRDEIVIPMGQSIGLSGRLTYKSDAKFIDMKSYVEKLQQASLATVLPAMFLPSSLCKSSIKMEYFPGQSETKEFHIRVKLTTKGQGHDLSSGPVDEQELENKGFNSIKQVLSQLEGPNSSATILQVTASSHGSQVKTIESAIVIGKKMDESLKQLQTFIAASMKPVQGNTVGVTFEGRMELPKLNNRWSIDNLIDESMKLKHEGKITFDNFNGQQENMIFNTQLFKTEKQKMSVKKSPEYQMCMTEQQKGRELSTVCNIVRQQAASLDRLVMEAKVPSSVYNSRFFTLTTDFLKSLLFGQVTQTVPAEHSLSGEHVTLLVEATADRTSEVAQVKVTTPSVVSKIENFRLLYLTKGLFPLTVLNKCSTLLTQQLFDYQAPATCHVEPKFIGTFDNLTYQYQINDCEHVLLLDGSKHLPIAVLTKTVSESKKMVKILAGVAEVKMVPASNLMKIILNGEEIPLSQGQTVVKKLSSGIVVECKQYTDNVYMVNMPSQFLTVLSDGTKIEIVAPQLLKSRSVGLCGVMNGETTTDLKTPRMCVMRPELSAVSYMLNKFGSSSTFPRCSGIPSEIREEYERESSKCIKEHIIPTPFTKLFSRITSLIKPTAHVHVVDEQRNQICISKQMVKVCSPQSQIGSEELVQSNQISGEIISKPSLLVPRKLQFVCFTRPSTIAQSLKKRALAGETLYLELEQHSVAYQKVQYEQITC